MGNSIIISRIFLLICFFCVYMCLFASYDNITNTDTTFGDLCRFEGMCLNCSEGDCDDMCQFYDNQCCLNISSKNFLPAKWQYSCLRKYPDMYDLGLDCHGSTNGVYGVYMVTKCSYLWEDALVKAECENSSEDNLLSSVPVYDTFYERVTYKNMFCAFCNWLSFDRIRFWKFDLLCNQDVLKNMSSNEIEFDPDVCFIRLVYRQYQICALNVIESCGENAGDNSALIDKCENGLSQNVYVWKYKENIGIFSVYKNEFCARCNEETGQLQCWAFQAFTCWPRTLPPYTRVNTRLSLNLYEHSKKNSLPVFNTTCGHGVLYDPFREHCLNMTCLPYLSTCISGKCHFVELAASEFTIQNDSTLYFLDLGEHFQTDRYLRKDLNAHVCLDDSQYVEYQYLRQTTLLTTENILNPEITEYDETLGATHTTSSKCYTSSGFCVQTLVMLFAILLEML